jgi:hypothetical protein
MQRRVSSLKTSLEKKLKWELKACIFIPGGAGRKEFPWMGLSHAFVSHKKAKTV